MSRSRSPYDHVVSPLGAYDRKHETGVPPRPQRPSKDLDCDEVPGHLTPRGWMWQPSNSGRSSIVVNEESTQSVSIDEGPSTLSSKKLLSPTVSEAGVETLVIKEDHLSL